MARINLSLPGDRTDFVAYSGDDPTQNQEALARLLGNMLWDLQDNQHQMNSDASADLTNINSKMDTYVTSLESWVTTVRGLNEGDNIPDPPELPALNQPAGTFSVQVFWFLIRILVRVLVDRVAGQGTSGKKKTDPDTGDFDELKTSIDDLKDKLDEIFMVDLDGQQVSAVRLLSREDVTISFADTASELRVYPAYKAFDDIGNPEE